MIEITGGTTEEQIIDILQKKYPITIEDIEKKLHLSNEVINRVLNRFQVKGIIQMEQLPDKTFIRLLRFDIKIVSKRRQKKFIKHHHRTHFVKKDFDDNNMYL